MGDVEVVQSNQEPEAATRSLPVGERGSEARHCLPLMLSEEHGSIPCESTVQVPLMRPGPTAQPTTVPWAVVQRALPEMTLPAVRRFRMGTAFTGASRRSYASEVAVTEGRGRPTVRSAKAPAAEPQENLSPGRHSRPSWRQLVSTGRPRALSHSLPRISQALSSEDARQGPGHRSESPLSRTSGMDTDVAGRPEELRVQDPEADTCCEQWHEEIAHEAPLAQPPLHTSFTAASLTAGLGPEAIPLGPIPGPGRGLSLLLGHGNDLPEFYRGHHLSGPRAATASAALPRPGDDGADPQPPVVASEHGVEEQTANPSAPTSPGGVVVLPPTTRRAQVWPRSSPMPSEGSDLPDFDNMLPAELSTWQVAEELGSSGGMAAPRYLLVRLGECIPAETGAAPVHLSRLDAGPQWRDFLNFGEGRDPRGCVSLDELLACPCCLSTYRQPVALPCGHSLCRGCYARVASQPQAARRCPLCRADLPQCEVRVNIALAAVCDSLRVFRAVSSRP